jgi:hypothetical protein
MSVDISEWAGVGSAGPGNTATGNASLGGGLTGPSISVPGASDLVIGSATSFNYSGSFPSEAPPGSTTFPSDNTNLNVYQSPGATGPFDFTWPTFGNDYDYAAAIQSFQPAAPQAHGNFFALM